MSDANEPKDEPRWDEAKKIERERRKERLAPGDQIQRWKTRRVEGNHIAWGWHEGEVLAAVDEPAEDGTVWVALVRWTEGDDIVGWSALTSEEWPSVLLRRKPA
jgi:hypothetical protein